MVLWDWEEHMVLQSLEDTRMDKQDYEEEGY